MKRGSGVLPRFRKGLSTIVSTLLILLLVFVAIGILWVVVRNVIQGGTEQVSLGKFTLDLSIENVQISANSISVRVKRNPGQGEFTGLSFILDDGVNTEVVEVKNVSMAEYRVRTFTLTLQSVIGSNVKTIEVAPIFTLESGKEVVGDVKDTYIISESGSGPVITTQCSQDSQCNDALVCTIDSCIGGSCSNTVITSCADNDGCCPSGCTSDDDNNCVDCSVDSQCDDSNAGTTDSCSSGTCVNSAITSCTGGDSYCPSTCYSSVDSDCTNECISAAQCDDSNSSTTDSCSSGSCVHTLTAECSVNADCDDSNAGTTDTCSSGSCVHTAITSCTNGDSYCPSSCDFTNDNDCTTPSWYTGLVSWWNFDSDLTDSVGTNDGGSINGGATHLTSGCKKGGCYDFDGVNDYLEIPNSASLSISGDKITMAAWAKTDSLPPGTARMILSKPVSSTTHNYPYFSYNLQFVDNSGIKFARPYLSIGGTGVATSSSGSNGITLGQWHHIVGVYDGTNLIMYIDGTSYKTSITAGNIDSYNTPLRIATNGGFNEFLDGAVDEVMIWNRALTPSEVSALYGYF